MPERIIFQIHDFFYKKLVYILNFFLILRSHFQFLTFKYRANHTVVKNFKHLKIERNYDKKGAV